MSQVSSWSVANAGGAAVRAAMNALFAALQGCSSGPAAPSPTVAGMIWFDTTNLILKVRNNANAAWITVTAETIAAKTFLGNSGASAAAAAPIDMATALTMLGFTAPGAPGLFACRAWVNFNGTGTPAIRASGNVASLTDLGTGSYRVNFTTAMPDANYAAIANCGFGASAAQWCRVDDQTTTSFDIAVIHQTASNVDTDRVLAAVFR